MEPVLLLGKHRFEAVDIRIRVKGGGNVSQIYGEHISQFMQASSTASSLRSAALALPPWLLFEECLPVPVCCPYHSVFLAITELSLMFCICLCSHPASNCKGHCGLLPEM